MKTAIYIRTSTEEQTPENQIKDCESLLNKDEQYKLYSDQQSAFKENVERESFNKLKNQIQKNKIKKLIVWDLDRLHRNRKNLLSFFNYCKLHKCDILSYRQKFLTEIQQIELPTGFEFVKDMMINNFLQFLGWIAEDESIKKSQRIKVTVRKKPKGTYSYKGNKWGRKQLSTVKRNQLISLIKAHPEYTIRKIGSELNLSKSVVHKYIKLLNIETFK